MTELLKNKKVLIAAGVALLVIVAMLFAVQAIGGGSGLDKQLSLGDKYLAALDYDNAILAFTKALSIDPMNVRAYTGLADAYIGKGDIAKAIETLQTGYDKTGDSGIKDKLDGLQPPSDVAAPGQPGDGNPADAPATAITLAVPLQYDYTAIFSEELAAVGVQNPGTEEMTYSYIDRTGNTVITLPPEVVEAHTFVDGKARIYRRGAEKTLYEYNFIDTTGKLLLDEWLTEERGYGGGGEEFGRVLYFSSPNTAEENFFVEGSGSGFWVGRRGVQPDAQCALFDKDLNILIPFGSYDNIELQSDGKTAIVQRAAGNNSDGWPIYKSGLVKVDGSPVLPLDYDYLHVINNQDYALQKDAQSPMQLQLSDGTLVEPQGVTAAGMESTGDPDRIIIMTKQQSDNGINTTKGVMDRTGKIILPPQYDMLTAINVGYVVQIDYQEPIQQLALPDGTIVEPQGYQATQMQELAEPGVIAFLSDGKWGVMDTTGKVVLPPEADNPGNLPGYTVVWWGFYPNKKIEAVVPAGMEQLATYSNCQIIATGKVRDTDFKLVPDVRVGLADLAGNILVKPTYEAISPIVEGVYVVCTAMELDEYGQSVKWGTYLLVSEDGTIQSDSFNGIIDIAENMVRVVKDNKRGFLEVKR